MSKRSIRRRIYYYDVEAMVLNAISNTVVSAANQKAILKSAFAHIKDLNNELAATDENDKDEIKRISDQFKYTTDNGDLLYIIVDDIDDDQERVKYRLVLCRTDAFPYIEKDGRLKTIMSEIPGDFNIAEITHCVMFLESGIMGAEFNFNGARPSAIINYIPRVFNQISQLCCVGKINDNSFDDLCENETLSLFKLGVRNTPEMRIKLRDSFGIIGGFFNGISEIDTYEISIHRRKTKKKDGFELPVSIDTLKEFADNSREDIQEFKISQGTYKDAIDLLNDRLVCTKKFVYTENKTIDSREMYATITNFYDSNVRN